MGLERCGRYPGWMNEEGCSRFVQVTDVVDIYQAIRAEVHRVSSCLISAWVGKATNQAEVTCVLSPYTTPALAIARPDATWPPGDASPCQVRTGRM